VTLVDKFPKAGKAPYPLSLYGECVSPALWSAPVARDAPKMRLNFLSRTDKAKSRALDRS
jgi:hypothetical protein